MIEAKYIPGTDYLVYSDGRIWSNKTHRFMKQCSNGRYMKVALCIKGKLKQFLFTDLLPRLLCPILKIKEKQIILMAIKLITKLAILNG